ncbi:MMPL family transporter [Streptomyces sp. NPDC057798]|uniref:MMPL family transporter n=1 Tax=Streptomyces sp. NPDC057798 TaxID=3346252 RepID=UPI0036A5668C
MGPPGRDRQRSPAGDDDRRVPAGQGDEGGNRRTQEGQRDLEGGGEFIRVNAAAAIGFGLSVDFTLFILARYREENAKGTPRPQALDVALRTSGRSVLCSAAVITSCLAAVAAVPIPLLRSLSVAGITVTLLAALAALSTVPAGLTLLGDRIDSGDPLRRLRRSPIGQASTFRRAVARAVTNRPLIAAAGALMLLGSILAWPASGTRLGVPDERGLPQSAPAGRGRPTTAVRRPTGTPAHRHHPRIRGRPLPLRRRTRPPAARSRGTGAPALRRPRRRAVVQ